MTNQTKELRVPEVLQTRGKQDWIDVLPCKHYPDFSVHYRNDIGCAHIDSHAKNTRIRGNTLQGEDLWLNEYQQFLFKEALFGSGAYSKQEWNDLHFSKQKKVVELNKRSWEVLNLFRQRIMNKMVNNLFRKFWKVDDLNKLDLMGMFANFVKLSPGVDINFRCKLTFEQLGVTKREIIGELMEQKVLPENFLELYLCDDPQNRFVKLKPKSVRVQPERLDA